MHSEKHNGFANIDTFTAWILMAHNENVYNYWHYAVYHDLITDAIGLRSFMRAFCLKFYSVLDLQGNPGCVEITYNLNVDWNDIWEHIMTEKELEEQHEHQHCTV